MISDGIKHFEENLPKYFSHSCHGENFILNITIIVCGYGLYDYYYREVYKRNIFILFSYIIDLLSFKTLD